MILIFFNPSEKDWESECLPDGGETEGFVLVVVVAVFWGAVVVEAPFFA